MAFPWKCLAWLAKAEDQPLPPKKGMLEGREAVRIDHRFQSIDLAPKPLTTCKGDHGNITHSFNLKSMRSRSRNGSAKCPKMMSIPTSHQPPTSRFT